MLEALGAAGWSAGRRVDTGTWTRKLVAAGFEFNDVATAAWAEFGERACHRRGCGLHVAAGHQLRRSADLRGGGRWRCRPYRAGGLAVTPSPALAGSCAGRCDHGAGVPARSGCCGPDVEGTADRDVVHRVA
ncbi:SUKH-3 domain-containing protein [Streptomyces anulatus]|uniref:SUKH-3 domain-containing protein n=1 Tax=Streptomyces anulatus TaxID=1892 RepID=UPI0035DC1E68